MTNITEEFSFELPTRIEYGVGVASKLGEEVRLLKAQKAVSYTHLDVYKRQA